MKRHINYLFYVLKHKWFVFLASLRIGSSVWLAIIHDLSKFRVSEWSIYSITFYDSQGKKRFLKSSEFDKSFLKHIHRNPHHWEYWLYYKDGKSIPLEMPKKYALEMLADWMGAGRAINGSWEYKNWYDNNKDRILIHPETKQYIETIIYKD